MACERWFNLTLQQVLDTGLGVATDKGCPLEKKCNKRECDFDPQQTQPDDDSTTIIPIQSVN